VVSLSLWKQSGKSHGSHPILDLLPPFRNRSKCDLFLVDIHSKIPEFGASGAIAGVMGAYIVMFPKARIVTLIFVLFFPFFVDVSAFFYIGFWFILQLFSGTLSFASRDVGGVAWWAHIGGFITGIVLLPFFRRKEYSHRKLYPDETYHYTSH